MKTVKEEPKDSDSFYCATCDQTVDGFPAIKEHLKSVHGIPEMKGTKSMVLHLDAAATYSSIYNLTIKGLVIQWTSVRVREAYKNRMALRKARAE